MNDLKRFLAIRSLIQPGDKIFYFGNSIVGRLIRLFALGPSHVAPVRQAAHQNFGGPTIIESTIEGKRNGVQTNDLEKSVREYHGSIAWAPLSAASRKRFDLQKFYEFCGASQDFVRYGDLGEYLLRNVPILGVRVAQTEDPKEMVCSQWACATDLKSGVLEHVNWFLETPQLLLERKLYDRWVPLVGNPQPVRFNTV